MMKPIDLIRLQICLEYQFDPLGNIVSFPNSSEQAWYIVYRYAGGYASYFNQSLPHKVYERLSVLGPVETFNHPDEVRELISDLFLPCRGGEEPFWSGYFNRTPHADEFPDVIQDDQVWVVKVNGQFASAAFSVRKNGQCGEVYVETILPFRRNGFGRQVVAAWVHHMITSGLFPFYNYRFGNTPSANLARKLEVEWYADALAFEPL